MADTPINPSSLVTDDAIVSETNPLPCVPVGAGAAATGVAINPTSFVVNDAVVSATNPLPITLS